MNVIEIPIDHIQPNPWNPNRQSDFIYEKELESLKTHGQLVPILVRALDMHLYEIIDGEHRFRAIKQLGWNTVTCNNLGRGIPDSTAQQLTIILNEVKGEADKGLLSDLLKQLEQDVGRDVLKQVMPFDSIELEEYLKTTKVDDSLFGIPAMTYEGELEKKENGQPSMLLDPEKDFPVTHVPTPAQEEQKRQASKNFSGGVVVTNPDSKTIYLKLPVEISEQFQRQIDRINLLLFPEEKDPGLVLPGTAIQVICQLVAQIEDEKIIL